MIYLFLPTKRLISRLLVSIGITTVSVVAVIDTADGTTIARSEGSLQFTNFSHTHDELQQFQSTFAYVLSEDDFAIIQSDPPFVTGVPVLFHPLAPQFTPISTSQSGENLVTAPLQLNSVTGDVFGHNNVSYSPVAPDRLSSANLSSASTFSVGNTDHLISTAGQSGFNISFFLEPEAEFTFEFQSDSELEASTNSSSTTEVKVTETKVIYFFAEPVNVDINNGILMFSLSPQLHLSANDHRIAVGLLELNETLTSQGTYSHVVNYNGSSQGSSPYFNLETPQNNGDRLKGTFEYVATQPTILTAVAYTSSVAVSSRSTKIPESSPGSSLIYLSLIVLGAKLIMTLSANPR